jgi:hypothetical protein
MTETATQDAENNFVTENKAVTDRDGRGRFLTGNNGGGRPKGSRNKLGEAFIQDAYAEWQISGPAALERMAQNDPSAFCRLIGGMLPQEVDATLSVDVDLLIEARTFAENFRLARQYIGADDEPPTIELKAEEPDGDV